MNRVLISMLVLVLGVSLGAAALTGSGNSSPGPLETVAPTVLSAMAATTASISVTFSEPMVSAGVLNPANYTLSGVGMGTLAQHPASVTGAEPYTLTWSTGEMRDGQSVNVTVAGVQDLVGNPISPAANSASYPGKGIAPVFSSLVASPAQAASGDSVTLTFTASEALTGEPELAVNGRAATFVSGVANAYTFTYVVADTDTLGMATIAVSGFDLAGNPGGLSSSTTLEIIQKAPGLPLYTWPGALLLLAIGTLVLRRLLKSPFEGGAAKRRGMFFLALVAFGALACSSAFAAPPAVTNVTFSQGPNGTTATQADIYYDLTAPNGPCDITVSLSKDGGADGFIHAVTTVTGDVIGVTAGTDKHIVWNIAADYPNETIANAAIRVLADDHLVQHAVTYAAVPPAGGSLLGGNAVIDDTTGTTSFTVAANPGYVIDAVTVSNGTLTGTGPYTLSNVTADTTVTASFSVPPVSEVSTFAINSGATTTMPLAVTLDNTATNVPVDYMASESASFTGAAWQPYGTAPAFTLSFGVGTRTVYFKVRDAALVESGVVSDTIFLVPQTVPVAAGTFPMGRLASGTNDDRTYGGTYEDPVHSVTLGAYTLGKCEVTNKEYCDVLNWAKAQGYLYSDAAGTAWAGTGDIYAGGAGFRFLIVSFSSTNCNIQHSGGVFTSKTRVGLPGTTNYSMDTHPMVMVSWYGSVAFCNWLSQWQGVATCYNMGAANWPLTVAPPTAGGYRLPTEAEWERAAAWDGTKHWIYGFLSDTNATGTANRCNDFNSFATAYDNPLGLTAYPYTSPVGWFNGVNVNPNGSVTTVNSPSPVGAYDMSGNVYEWCGDWYLDTYYTSGGPPWNNPTGPASGTRRVNRGSAWNYSFFYCRSAYRTDAPPAGTNFNLGFRLSRS